MGQKALLLCIALTGALMISGNCPNRSPTDDFVTRIREARDRIAPPSGEVTLPPGEHIVDIDVNCLTADPDCLVIVTRPMYRRERPRTLKVRLPYSESRNPFSITVRETGRGR